MYHSLTTIQQIFSLLLWKSFLFHQHADPCRKMHEKKKPQIDFINYNLRKYLFSLDFFFISALLFWYCYLLNFYFETIFRPICSPTYIKWTLCLLIFYKMFCLEYNIELYLMVRLQSWSLENVEYPFFTITLRSTLTQNGSTC